ncbi:hypothetical protein TW95_gp0031 [Pandoravirus inopinatum]|uniref:Uncharacterized protein n=1 Tax=Pandoravirus inopinatum TaxID=1605721 RepID=A0A0B5J570_9VIRU|nr:hypothetical protein TW95_gp0031 [Pandoravirus inopinatum]AJF96765.1 hypothetical protein [Pandoravirus inopinatum]
MAAIVWVVVGTIVFGLLLLCVGSSASCAVCFLCVRLRGSLVLGRALDAIGCKRPRPKEEGAPPLHARGDAVTDETECTVTRQPNRSSSHMSHRCLSCASGDDLFSVGFSHVRVCAAAHGQKPWTKENIHFCNQSFSWTRHRLSPRTQGAQPGRPQPHA